MKKAYLTAEKKTRLYDQQRSEYALRKIKRKEDYKEYEEHHHEKIEKKRKK